MSKFAGMWIPAKILERRDMAANEKLVLGYVMSFPERCFASNEHIGKMLGLTPKAVANILTRLRAMGLFTGRKFPNEGSLEFPNQGSQSSLTREHRYKRDKSRDISTDFPKPGKPVSTGKYDIHHPFHPLIG